MSDFNLPENKVPTEDEMTAIRGLFARAADAIVNASNLNKKVNEMGEQITRLQAEVESINRYNRSLVEQLSDLRQKNAELQAKIDSMSEELSRSRQLMAQRDDEIKALQDRSNAQAETIVRLRRESDDWQAKANLLDTVQGTLRNRVGVVVQHVKDIDAVLNPPAPPAPLAEEPSHVSDWANPVGQVAGTGQAGDGDQPNPTVTPTSNENTSASSEPHSESQPEPEEYRPWPVYNS